MQGSATAAEDEDIASHLGLGNNLPRAKSEETTKESAEEEVQNKGEPNQTSWPSS